MRGRLLYFLVFFVLPVTTVKAQEHTDSLAKQLQNRGEIYVSMKKSRLKAAAYLPEGVSIDRVAGDSVFLYFHTADTAFIRHYRGDLTLMTPPSKLSVPLMADSIKQVLDGEAYPTYDQYLSIMKFFADTWPQLCTIDTIGRSSLGRLILCAVINKDHYKGREVPEVFYSSTIHGDEVVGYSLMIRLIDLLLSRHETPSISDVLRDKIIRINPISNPDGTYFQSDTSVYGAIRANARYVDLNRNYPDPQDGDHPDGRDWQPENVVMMDYLKAHPPALSANFHGGSQVFNYPFDTWSYLHADDDWFRLTGREYADTAVYMTDLNRGVTNGFDWYQVNGGRQDYVTWFLYGREVTIELSHDKMPPASELNSFWNMNRSSLLNFIRQADYGILGHVRDSDTGQPLESTITIPGHDKLHSEVYSSSTGVFFRYLSAGTYYLSVTAPGYITADSVFVNVANYDRSEVNIELVPDAGPDKYSAGVEPNPFTDYFDVVVNSPGEGPLTASLYSLSGAIMYQRSFVMKAGTNRFKISPGPVAPGMYILVLSSAKFNSEMKIVRGQ